MGVNIYLLSVSVLILIFAALLIVGNYGTKAAGSKKLSKKEKRTRPRYKTSIRIKYKTPLEEWISWIKDISEKGARLFLNSTLKSLEIGESLGIEISIPHDPQPVIIEGNIVWSREDDAGVDFANIIQGDINRIIKYIQSEE